LAGSPAILKHFFIIIIIILIISIKQPILKVEVVFFPIEKLFRKTAKWSKFSYSKLIMTDVSANLKNIFFSQNPRILKVEVGFFSDRQTSSSNG